MSNGSTLITKEHRHQGHHHVFASIQRWLPTYCLFVSHCKSFSNREEKRVRKFYTIYEGWTSYDLFAMGKGNKCFIIGYMYTQDPTTKSIKMSYFLEFFVEREVRTKASCVFSRRQGRSKHQRHHKAQDKSTLKV